MISVRSPVSVRSPMVRHRHTERPRHCRIAANDIGSSRGTGPVILVGQVSAPQPDLPFIPPETEPGIEQRVGRNLREVTAPDITIGGGSIFHASAKISTDIVPHWMLVLCVGGRRPGR